MAVQATIKNLPLLADPADLEGLVDSRGSAGGGQARSEKAVRRASERFRAAVRHPVSRVTGQTFTLDGPGGDVLRLPVLHPTFVSGAINGEPVTDVQASPTGYLYRRAGFPAGFGNIVLTLDHGYEEVPGDIADAVLEQAARLLNTQPGLQMLVLDGATVQFRPETGVSQTWAEAVKNYRIGAGDRA